MARKKNPKLIPDWSKVRRAIKPLFYKAGVRRCELEDKRFKDKSGNLVCTQWFSLTFAHSLTRDTINGSEDPLLMQEVVMACRNCHDELEKLGESKMCRLVRKVIKNRQRKVELIYDFNERISGEDSPIYESEEYADSGIYP